MITITSLKMELPSPTHCSPAAVFSEDFIEYLEDVALSLHKAIDAYKSASLKARECPFIFDFHTCLYELLLEAKVVLDTLHKGNQIYHSLNSLHRISFRIDEMAARLEQWKMTVDQTIRQVRAIINPSKC